MMLQPLLIDSPPSVQGSSWLPWLEAREAGLVALLLLAFLLLCGGLERRYVPWGDEAQFVEPAANLHNGLGFVSREHSNQNDQTFWAGNVPGYSGLLAGTFAVFGVSQTAARVLNYLTMALAALGLWVAVRRAGMLRQGATRLLLLLLVLTSYSCYTCYANIRYDGLCLLECVLVVCAYTLRPPAVRHGLLLLLGAVMFLTNLQLPQYSLALLLILALTSALRFRSVWQFGSLFLGFLAGGVTLVLIYVAHPGAWKAFAVTLEQQAGQSVWEKLGDLPDYFQYDMSLGALLFFFLVMLLLQRRGVPGAPGPRTAVTGLAICLAIPVLFFVARRFVFSSVWMAYVPAAVCLCQVIERQVIGRQAIGRQVIGRQVLARGVPAPRSGRALAWLCCLVSIAFGLPKTLVGVWTDWSVRNYAVIERFVVQNVRGGDVVLCDAPAYFAAKPRVARLYGPGYLDVMNATEKQSVTLLIITPATQADVTRRLGGRWQVTQELNRDSRTSTERLLPLSTRFSCRLQVLHRL